MTLEEQQLHLIRGAIAGMPVEDQVKVKYAEAELRAIILKHGQHGILALALLGAEEAAKPE